MADEQKTCSLCDAELDTTGYPLWCKACRTSKKKALKEAHEQMATGKGFAAGAEQMRRAMVDQLAKLNPAALTNFNEIMLWIRDFPSPRP